MNKRFLKLLIVAYVFSIASVACYFCDIVLAEDSIVNETEVNNLQADEVNKGDIRLENDSDLNLKAKEVRNVENKPKLDNKLNEKLEFNVDNIQKKLVELGYLDINEYTEGQLDKNTSIAIKLFKISNDMVQDELLDSHTAQIILKSNKRFRPVTFMEKSKRILYFQNLLKQKGVFSARSDGWWGNKSAGALKLYRYFNGSIENTSKTPDITELKKMLSDNEQYRLDKVISINDIDVEIKTIQSILKKNGYLAEKDMTGVFDYNTSTAIKILQISNNIYPDGLVGKKTRPVLVNDIKPFKPVRYMENSTRVWWVQNCLQEKGIYFGLKDSKFGPKTKNAFNLMHRLLSSEDANLEEVNIDIFNLLFDDKFLGTKYIEATSSLGDINAEILKAKVKLHAIGFDKQLKINTEFDNEFDKTIKMFQAFSGMYSDGIMGAKTVKALNAYNHNFRNIQFNDSGHVVYFIQKKLKELGYFDYYCDGKFGNKTREAVKDFQFNNDIGADGIIGKKTMAKLISPNAVKFIRYKYSYGYYYAQNDSRWSNKKYGYSTLGRSGCVPTVFSMALASINNSSVWVPTIADWLYKNTREFNKRFVGTSTKGIYLMAKNYGLKTKTLYNMDDVTKALNRGMIVICQVGRSKYASAGVTHAILLHGHKSGKTTVYDPLNKYNNGSQSISYLWSVRSKDTIDIYDGTPFVGLCR